MELEAACHGAEHASRDALATFLVSFVILVTEYYLELWVDGARNISSRATMGLNPLLTPMFQLAYEYSYGETDAISPHHTHANENAGTTLRQRCASYHPACIHLHAAGLMHAIVLPVTCMENFVIFVIFVLSRFISSLLYSSSFGIAGTGFHYVLYS